MKHSSEINRRKYIRLDSVFPVDFRLVAQDNQTFLSDWIQGFTNDISWGGICLSVNNLSQEFVELIQKGKVNLLVNIQIPLSSKGTPACTKPIWIKLISNQPGKYLIGISYSDISASANKRIVGYARMKYLVPRLSAGLLILLVLISGLSGYFNWRLKKENLNLVSKLAGVIEDSTIAKETINKINKDKEELNSGLKQIQEQIKNVEGQRNQLSRKLIELQKEIEGENNEALLQEEIQRLALLVGRLKNEKVTLQQKLFSLQQKETRLVEDSLVLEQRKAALQQATFDNMYEWLTRHQNPRSGLILSFEGDQDFANWAFTYDQALVVCLHSFSANFQHAQKILNFFRDKAEKVDGGFLNAYYTNDGKPAEYIVHSGPNIWLGIAILQYTHNSQDERYLDIAKEIADWTIKIQNEDKDGGIRGGPKVSWYATEHNLDAYAFFNMFYKISGKQEYKENAMKVLDWLLKHTYDQPDVPVKRGKGDSTIATDTYAWSISALGPEKLDEIGMRPEDIIKFAEDKCYVEVDFIRPENNVIRVKGFDFAAQRNLARGGVISCEWTAQMILSFKIMARFYRDKQMLEAAQAFQNKADDYLWQLSRMIISSPSPSGQGWGCLPYASSDFVNTGHGWITPKGSSTGSVAATAYTLFAYYGYNPLQLADKEVASRE
ncbi:MAG: hypothetical protein ABH914_03620 [Candidatus Omnitrophota bacterium]